MILEVETILFLKSPDEALVWSIAHDSHSVWTYMYSRSANLGVADML